jgi:hypothetical protein
VAPLYIAGTPAAENTSGTLEGGRAGTTLPPGVFLRKDVILWELGREFAQGSDFKGLRGNFWYGRVGSGVIRIT